MTISTQPYPTIFLIENGRFFMEIKYGECHCGCGKKTTIAKRNFLYKGIKKGEHIKFIRGHFYVRPAIERFWERVNKMGQDDCWEWIAGKDVNGYGSFLSPLAKEKRWHGEGAHRYSYRIHNGEIPKNLFIDHLCQNPSCVNPNHLEAVTNRENLRRGNGPIGTNAKKTHCIHGHPFDKNNTYWRNTKWGIKARMCRTCMRLKQRARYRRINNVSPSLWKKP